MSKDTIYRQDVINGVKTLHDVAWKNWHEPTLSPNVVLDMIRELPSARPEIVRCRDCKEYYANDHRCRWWNHGTKEAGWCYVAERREE